MKAMILAAGRGERMYPLTLKTPKPMLPVAGQPLIERQLKQLSQAGVREVIINLHHLGHVISDALGDGSQFGLNITYSVEENLLETGGGIVNALPLLGDDPFIILNGDIYSDFDFASLPQTLKPNALTHLVLTPKPAYRTSGDFNFDKGLVTSRGNAFIYTGIAVCDPKLFKNQSIVPFSWMQLVFPATALGQVSGQVFQGKWADIGLPAQYQALNQLGG